MEITPYQYCGKTAFDLDNWATKETTAKAQLQAQRTLDLATLQGLQQRLFAQKQVGVVIILQGMDTAGKDSLIRNVFSGLNPAGTSVVSFKQPTSVDLAHDFLWRINQQLPPRGEIRVFNRSQYEDVLVGRVHPEILTGQHLPDITTVADVTDQFFVQRYADLRHYEKYLRHQGILTYKFFLHLSKTEQRHRLMRRLTLPDKHWKFDLGDIRERQYWDAYRAAYTQMIAHTATKKNPWYIVPADDKPTARLIVANILTKVLTDLDPQYPRVTPDQQAKLQQILNDLQNGSN